MVIAVQLANCWLTVEVLPDGDVYDVRRQVQAVVPAAGTVYTDMSEVVSLVANSRLADDF